MIFGCDVAADREWQLCMMENDRQTHLRNADDRENMQFNLTVFDEVVKLDLTGIGFIM